MNDPRIVSAHFSSEHMDVRLDDGRTLCLPYAWYPKLAVATREQRRDFRIICDGRGLSWPALDEDLSTRGFLTKLRELGLLIEAQFPVHWGQLQRGQKEEWTKLGCPRTVPWDFLRPHEQQALDNHSQSLAKLAERGGLGPAEMLAVVEDKSFREAGWSGGKAPSDELAIPVLLEKLAAFAIKGGD